jgi:hypothetical protein
MIARIEKLNKHKKDNNLWQLIVTLNKKEALIPFYMRLPDALKEFNNLEFFPCDLLYLYTTKKGKNVLYIRSHLPYEKKYIHIFEVFGIFWRDIS